MCRTRARDDDDDSPVNSLKQQRLYHFEMTTPIRSTETKFDQKKNHETPSHYHKTTALLRVQDHSFKSRFWQLNNSHVLLQLEML